MWDNLLSSLREEVNKYKNTFCPKLEETFSESSLQEKSMAELRDIIAEYLNNLFSNERSLWIYTVEALFIGHIYSYKKEISNESN